MLTLSQFRTRFPEFAAVTDPTMQAFLDAAELRTDAEVFGALASDAHGWLAAHLAAASPQGREARLTKSSEKTLYLIERESLETICGAAWGAT